MLISKAMAWKWIKTFVYLSMCITSAVGNEEASPKCADFNNTTWLEYRQGTKLQVQYLLLTRKNADCASLFTQDCLNHTQKHTAYFNSSLPTKVIVHGYRALGSKPSWVSGLAQALLREEDVNVLVVDWVYGASFAYNLVVENYKEVAVQISVLINQLTKYGSTLESFHFIGVSLGAHVSGFVGTLFEGKLGRITGLDPAGPMFKSADPFDRLDSSDALFVEAIHTDSDYFGISIPVGHVDFFLNGGMDQAGCARSRFASIFIYFPVYGYVICDHMRALHVYMSALNSSCSLIGFPCSSYEEFLAGKCITCQGPFNGTCPQIGLLKNSGITANPLPNQEKVYLLTTATAPYCAHHILVELKVSALDKTADVQLTLISVGHPETELKLKLNTDELVHKKLAAHPEQLCKIDSVQLKNTGARFYRQGDIHFEYICISEVPQTRGLDPLCVKNINIGRGVPWSHDFVQLC
ncbi:phospholipase A1 member A-like isoform X1 [Sinocyclocheilus rhinocerous]|uniref:Phospholipase A1 member A n=1 Tax=Sinocyclocheilus rhinocerous TaxID=307959 RepID=A0A673HLW3_9TELE|nr:PREDICTED: phospholipase A1 member A-like isoform X1 [Sinocyclocheilus rhinocerous]XP_016388957.1 PREDICTED: phospholipase A1 member A-like isoform X1 [Sinocyclocheilus rhinocerous]